MIRPEATDRSGRRSGWPALLASSAARAALMLLLGLLLASLIPAIAGWHPSVVLTGSMQPLVRPGDVVVARPVHAEQFRPGQVLLVDDPDRPGRLRLHRLARTTDDGHLVLRGDANPAEDSSPVSPAAVHGVAALRVPGIGLPMLWARQGRYGAVAGLAALLGGLVSLALLYRPAEQQPRPRRPPDRRLGRMAAATVLAGLAALQLTHPAPAQAKFTVTAIDSANGWQAAQYYSCRQLVLADSPVLYYQLNETSGTTVTDSSGTGATGSYASTGVTLSRPGTCGYDQGTAVTLNGSSGYLYRNGASASPSTYTYEIWFATTTTRGGWLMGLGSSQSGLSSSADRQLYLTNTGQVGFGVLNNSKKKTAVLSPASYNDGGWHLADASFSLGTGMRLYLDGQLVASTNTVSSVLSYSGYLRIGYDSLTGWASAPTSNFLAGSVDEAAAYATVLSSTQIGNHYAAGG
ncbi:MAG: LamG-like jellyroll fold domain-containing protein [Jatrophihabitantaceae bacterium]